MTNNDLYTLKLERLDVCSLMMACTHIIIESRTEYNDPDTADDRKKVLRGTINRWKTICDKVKTQLDVQDAKANEKKTLEELLEQERQHRVETGDFGIIACKESIIFTRDKLHKSLFAQLEEYIWRANNEPFFNKAMVLACWELINER